MRSVARRPAPSYLRPPERGQDDSFFDGISAPELPSLEEMSRLNAEELKLPEVPRARS